MFNEVQRYEFFLIKLEFIHNKNIMMLKIIEKFYLLPVRI